MFGYLKKYNHTFIFFSVFVLVFFFNLELMLLIILYLWCSKYFTDNTEQLEYLHSVDRGLVAVQSHSPV